MFSCEYCTIFEAASNYGSLIVFLENICYSEQKKSTILSKVSLQFWVKAITVY